MQASHVDPSTGEDELALAAAGAQTLARAGITPQARGRAQSERSVDLGQGRPQRGLPLRLGQEIQALPRAVRLARVTAVAEMTKEPGKARRFSFADDVHRLSGSPTSGVEVAGRHRPRLRRRCITAPWLRRCAGVGRLLAAGCGGRRRGLALRLVLIGCGLGLLRRGSRHARRRWSACAAGFGFGARCAVSLGVVSVSLPRRPTRRAMRSSAPSLVRLLGFGRLRREQAAEQAAAARLCGRLARAWSRRWPSRVGATSPDGRRRPAPATTARRQARGCAAAAPSPEWCRAACETRTVASCGATPIWFFFTASTNTGFMPPSALVLIGAIGVLRRLSSANCASSLLLFVAHQRWRSLPAPRTPGTWPVGLNDSARAVRRLRRRTRSACRRR